MQYLNISISTRLYTSCKAEKSEMISKCAPVSMGTTHHAARRETVAMATYCKNWHEIRGQKLQIYVKTSYIAIKKNVPITDGIKTPSLKLK